jgi:nitronate monooxygenase
VPSRPTSHHGIADRVHGLVRHHSPCGARADGRIRRRRPRGSREALVDPEIVKAIIARSGDDTERSRVLDIARGAPWPPRYTARTLRNAFLEEWRGREDELATDDGTRQAYAQAASAGDLAVIPVWASEAIDLIDDIPSAVDVVPEMVANAETALASAITR